MQDLPNPRRRLLGNYPRALPVVIFILVAAVTVLSVFAIERGEAERERVQLVQQARDVSAAIERRASNSSAVLRAGAALFAAQKSVDADVFRRFVSELRADAEYQGSEGIGWAPAITASQVPALEALLNRDRAMTISIEPSLAARPREMLTPIVFLQPDTIRNRRAIGFDMYSEPTRRAAMDEAAQSLKPTASGKVLLKQEGGAQSAGFLIYMPVYDLSPQGRVLKGFIYSPFNAAQFLESASELINHETFGIELRDARSSQEQVLARIAGGIEGGASESRAFTLAGRPMVVTVRSGRESVLSRLSMITLLFGMAVASMLMLIARLLTQQADEDRRLLDWFAQQNSIRDSLTRELNHRVKNTLANVLSIIALTRRRATSLDDFATGIDGRIRALSATHDLLTQSEWGTTPIRAVVEAELAPYTRHDGHDVILEGPAVELAPNDALSLGLAIHELATNAAKYGALSVPDGRVDIRWEMVGEALARVEWTESRGPAVTTPRKRGFGTDLLEKIVAHELRHPVELEFAESGVHCTLLAPVREHGEFALRDRAKAPRGH